MSFPLKHPNKLYTMNIYAQQQQSNWMMTYNSGADYELWLRDCMKWQHARTPATSNWTLLSFLQNYTSPNTYSSIVSVAKVFDIDLIAIQSLNSRKIESTYYLTNALDQYLLSPQMSIYLKLLLQAEYCDTTSTVLITNPEILTAISDFMDTHFSPNYSFQNVATLVNSYTSKLDPLLSNGPFYGMMFYLFVWMLLVLITQATNLKVSAYVRSFLTWIFDYIQSRAKLHRFQYEAVTQTILFFFVYWVATLLTFDDTIGESIGVVDSTFFSFFVVAIFYLCFKYAVHYFAFIEASGTSGPSFSYIARQCSRDMINSFIVLLRFYLVLFRLNVYDMFDDFFDSYYIFVGDFDDDEYYSELLTPFSKTVLSTRDNKDNRSFLLQNLTILTNDVFYLYYLAWGKFMYYLFLLVEGGARFGLAFYVCYLIIFEIHSVRCCHKEDNYFARKFNQRKI